ncbi:hypothetical protein ES702_07269 [subsurface metagenome]
MDNPQYNFYEFLSYILPGCTLLGVITYSLSKLNVGISQYLGLLTSWWGIFTFVAIAFAIGHLLQGISNPVETIIYKLKWKGYPSEKLLREDDSHFSREYKELLLRKISGVFKLSEKARPQELFYSCYLFLIQKGVGRRIERFLAMHGFYRGMMVACGISTVLFFVLFLGRKEIHWVIATIVFLFCAIIFYRRFLRFSIRFADAVYREFFVYNL